MPKHLTRLQAALLLLASLILVATVSSILIVLYRQSLPAISEHTPKWLETPLHHPETMDISGSVDDLLMLWSGGKDAASVSAPYAAASIPATPILINDLPMEDNDPAAEDRLLSMATQAPEPTSIALLALGMIGLGIARRRVRKQNRKQ